MGVSHGGPRAPMDDDPDDYRPRSVWRLAVDPDGRTEMAVIWESIAAGDRIPRHRHDVDEVIIVEHGEATVHVDGVDVDVTDGATVFVPAGAIHGTRNRGVAAAEIRGVFPTTRLRMEMVERNPMPGTEQRPPSITVYDARTGIAEVIGPTDPASSPGA